MQDTDPVDRVRIPLDRTVHLALTAHSIPLLPFICRVPAGPVRRFCIRRSGCRRPRRHQRRQSSRCAGRARYHFPPQRRWQYRSTEPMREQIDQLQAFSCDFPSFAVLSKAFTGNTDERERSVQVIKIFLRESKKTPCRGTGWQDILCRDREPKTLKNAA